MEIYRDILIMAFQRAIKEETKRLNELFGKNESAEILRYAEHYQQSINLDKRPEIHGIPVFVVDADSRFGLKAGR